MAEFSAADAAFTGFRVVRRRPWLVAVWALLQFTVSLASLAFVSVSAGPAFQKASQLGLGTGAASTQEQVTLLSQLAPTYAVLCIGLLVFYAVLYGAMNRAVLRPDEARFGYLRLAADELRQLGLLTLLALMEMGLFLAIVFLASVLVAVVGVAAGSSAELGIALGVVVPASIAAFLFLGVRLSLASPLSFAHGRIDLVGSWRLTRGRFWPILGAYLISFALSMVVLASTSVIAMAVLAVAGGGMGAIGPAVQPDLSSLPTVFTPLRIAYSGVASIGAALAWPVTMCPPAAILQALQAKGAVSKVFD